MIVLITGGSGSGKSEYGENLAMTLNKDTQKEMLYIATMYPYGEETMQKIKRHQRMRKEKHFETVECYKNIEKISCLSTKEERHELKEKTVMLECMSNLLANEMFMDENENDNSDSVITAIEKGLDILFKSCKNIVIISNEIFSDSSSYNPQMKKYIECLGKLNSYIADRADKVIEVVYSIPIYVKGEKTDVV